MQFNRHTFPVQRKMAHSKHEKTRRDFEPNMDQNPLTPKGTKEDGSMCALPLCALAHCLTTKRRPDGGAPRSAQESSAGRVRTSESGPTRAAQARAPRASRFRAEIRRSQELSPPGGVSAHPDTFALVPHPPTTESRGCRAWVTTTSSRRFWKTFVLNRGRTRTVSPHADRTPLHRS